MRGEQGKKVKVQLPGQTAWLRLPSYMWMLVNEQQIVNQKVTTKEDQQLPAV